MPEELTEADRKKLDRKIGQLKRKVSETREAYDALVEELEQLLLKRYPERKEENIKKTLYAAYRKSHRSMEEILAFMEGRDDDIDW
jgi:ribosomal protein S4